MRVIDSWLAVMKNELDSQSLFSHLSNSYPPLVSILFTRQCNLSCRHCIYPPANQLDLVDQTKKLKLLDAAIWAAQNAGVNHLVHAGRILLPEHLPILKKYQDLGMSLHLIDNGSAAKLVPQIKDLGIFFKGGIDISLDGRYANHIAQRNANSWSMALEGIYKLPQVTDSLSIIGAASTINYRSLVIDYWSLQKDFEHIATWQITTTSPSQKHSQRMALNREEMRTLFAQILAHCEKLNLHLTLYRLEDLESILDMLKPLGPPEEKYISLQWTLGNVIISFFPPSLVLSEEFFIDYDGALVMPFSSDWHLSERPEERQISHERFFQDPDKCYQELVVKYYQQMGTAFLEQEKKLFQNFF